MKPPRSDPRREETRRPKDLFPLYDWLQKIHTHNTITYKYTSVCQAIPAGLYSSRALIHLKETVMRAEGITPLSCVCARIRRGSEVPAGC